MESKNCLTSKNNRVTLAGLLVTMGIVFGDIGTSPLYVMKAIVRANPGFTDDYIIGAVSCVIWTLTLQTTLKYVLIALRADNKGEGGILALYVLLRRNSRRWLYVVAAIGAAALVADGIITPPITVTSAMEGIGIKIPEVPVLPIVVVIITIIFMIQHAGTGKIGRWFGPFMLVWFLMLGVLGAVNLPHHPAILKAFNPWYAVELLVTYPSWFLVLGAVFLCTTGAEALYSDLGHCGRKNISVAWVYVKTMLILNYLGQGAWLIAHRGTHLAEDNPFYAIMPHWFTIAGVVMATGAAIIASQALLSGSFTIFSEAMGLDFWPKLEIKYPSPEKGQLYIPTVNWALLAGCLLTVFLFRTSSNMEAAYGLSITIAMLMTTVLITFWMRSHGVNRVLCGVFMTFFVVLEGLFFLANLSKFPHGGWFSVLVAAVAVAVMLVWRNARRVRESFVEYRNLAECAPLISAIKHDKEIPHYASNLVYLSRSKHSSKIESKLIYSIVNKQPKRADHYWFIHTEFVDEPDTLEYKVDIIAPDTIFFVTMRLGFRVPPKLSVYLRQVVEDLVERRQLDLVSSYPSLRSAGVPGDFRFIILHRIFSLSSNCTYWNSVLMRLYDMLRKTGTSDLAVLGLDTSVVTYETIPLIINTNPGRRIKPEMPEEMTDD